MKKAALTVGLEVEVNFKPVRTGRGAGRAKARLTRCKIVSLDADRHATVQVLDDTGYRGAKAGETGVVTFGQIIRTWADVIAGREAATAAVAARQAADQAAYEAQVEQFNAEYGGSVAIIRAAFAPYDVTVDAGIRYAYEGGGGEQAAVTLTADIAFAMWVVLHLDDDDTVLVDRTVNNALNGSGIAKVIIDALRHRTVTLRGFSSAVTFYGADEIDRLVEIVTTPDALTMLEPLARKTA